MLNLLKLKQEKAAAKEGGAGEEGGKAGGKVMPKCSRSPAKSCRRGLPSQAARQVGAEASAFTWTLTQGPKRAVSGGASGCR